MKCFILAISLLLITQPSFAYIEKIYNECGEKMGSVRRIGEDIEWYDYEGNKVNSFDEILERHKANDKVKIIVGTPFRFKSPFYKTDCSDCRKNVYYIPRGGYRIIRTKYPSSFIETY